MSIAAKDPKVRVLRPDLPKRGPKQPRRKKPAMTGDAAASLGIAGWMLAGELMTLMHDRGLLSTTEVELIMARALVDAEAVTDLVQGEAPEGAIEALRRLRETWRPGQRRS